MSSQAILVGLCLVVILSVLSRLFGDWVKIPVIVPLLAVGVIAGDSVTGLVNPTELLGSSFSPIVQIIVALILFEGALGLKFSRLPKEVRPAVTRLITLGVLVTWWLSAVGVLLFLGLPWGISILIGAIIIVSGPTVVLPMLSFIRPSPRVQATLRWEGVMMDPIGAVIAVVVFEALSTKHGFTFESIAEFIGSLALGTASGVVFAFILVRILRIHRFSGRDKVAATLMMVVAAFLAADVVFQDSGLVAALVMGIVLANQSRVNVTYIEEFKETLIPILLGILFILLAADVKIPSVIDLGLGGIALVAFLVIVVRPLDVLTTIGLSLTWKERLLMMTFSSRGIVAAATAPVYGAALVAKGVKGADEIVPVVFLVIVGTVLVSSILGPLAAKVLGLSGKGLPSMLVVGAPDWAVALGRTLGSNGIDVKFWTVESGQAEKVKKAGLDVATEALDVRDPDRISGLNELSLVTVASEDDALNQMLAYELSESLEPDQVYVVPPGPDAPRLVEDNAGRAIRTGVGFDEIEQRVEGGQGFALFDSDEDLPDGAVPLVVLETTKRLAKPELYFHCDRPTSPRGRVRRVAALVPSAAPAG